jgi:recombination protein RecA
VPEDPAQKRKSVLDGINKQFGKGAIVRLGDEDRMPVEVIPTGSIALDRALGIGGLPRGGIVEAFGPESSGKTSIALHCAAMAQKNGGIVAFIDAEHAFDPEWAAALGVGVDDLLMSQPDTGEQALEIADRLLDAGLAMIIIDSVAALVPKAEIDGEMGDTHVGLQARLMSQALRKIAGRARAAQTTVFFINQLREKVGVMFGPTETTSGGKALKFYASVRLDVRRIETLKDGIQDIGYRMRVKVVKNKCARPHLRAEVDFLYGEGIARGHELIDLGTAAGVVRKAGAWYTHDGAQLGQGKAKAAQFLRDHPDVADRIELELLAAEYGDKVVVLPPGPCEEGPADEDPLAGQEEARPASRKHVRITG